MEISLTLFVEGNSRGGRWKPERRENCTFDTCAAAAFRGRSSFAKWRVPLSVAAAICQCRQFLRRGVGGSFQNWRLSSLHTLSPLQNNGGNMNCEVHFWRSWKEGWLGGHHHQRPTESRVMLYDRILPSFLSDPTKCPITNEASQFDTGVPRLGRSSFEIHL